MANNNGKTWRLVVAIVALVLSLLGVAFCAGKYCDRVDDLKATAKKADANERAIIRLEAKVDYLVLGVDEIKGKLNAE